jgi:hypothetical protein
MDHGGSVAQTDFLPSKLFAVSFFRGSIKLIPPLYIVTLAHRQRACGRQEAKGVRKDNLIIDTHGAML